MHFPSVYFQIDYPYLGVCTNASFLIVHECGRCESKNVIASMGLLASNYLLSKLRSCGLSDVSAPLQATKKMQVIRPPHAEMANIQFRFSFTFAMWFKCNVTGNYCSKVVIWLWLVQHEWVGTFGSRSLQGTAETHKGSPSRCLSFFGGYHRSPSTSSGELSARLSQNVTVITAHFGGMAHQTWRFYPSYRKPF